ncbi:MAG: ADP-ribosylglycohydrolase family protein [bacterium]
MTDARERFRGALLGLACGDALGATVEFKARGTFPPLEDMVGGGPFRLRAGDWTDDTSMALCLARSLVETGRFDPRDQLERYVRWWRDGYLASTGKCFDIGNTVRAALERFLASGDPRSGSTDPRSAGNGSLMRLAPVPMFFAPDLAAAIAFSGESSRTTHGSDEAVDACRLFGAMLARALAGADRSDVLGAGDDVPAPIAPRIAALARGEFRAKSESQIRGTGYVVESLEAALFCFDSSGTFGDAVLRAANLGDDADTTAAICGQLAGAFYGAEEILPAWRAKLAMRALIEETADALREARPP